MLVTLIISILLCTLAWVYWRWTQVRQYWARRNVAFNPPHPLLGNLTFLLKENPTIWMRRMYFKFKRPYFGMWVFWRPALVINDPEIIRRVLVKDFDVFNDRFLSSGKNDPLGGLNLFAVNDPVWSSVRKRLTPVFTAAKLRSLNGLLTTKSKELVQRIKNDTAQKKRIDLRSLFANYTTDVIGTAAFGVACDATLTGDGPMKRIADDIMKFSVYRGLAWCCIFFFPELVNFFRFSFYSKSTETNFRKIYHAIVEERKKNVTENKKKDLLAALLQIKEDAARDNEDLDEDLLIAQAAIYFQGGFETSATNLTLITYYLAFHQDVQERLYTELLEAKERNGGAELDSTALAEVKYLDCVMNEILRIAPPMGWLDRVAAKDYKIDDNLTISAGTPVYLNGVGLHMDPEYFPEPDKFNPDRFLPENEWNIKPYTFLPFGEGPRVCIGKRFAVQQIHYAAAAVVLEFKLMPLPGATIPSQIGMDKRGLFYHPEESLSVAFVPRN